MILKQGYEALSGRESGISRDGNKEYQNWLGMHYKNQKNTRFSRFSLNLKLLTGKKLDKRMQNNPTNTFQWIKVPFYE